MISNQSSIALSIDATANTAPIAQTTQQVDALGAAVQTASARSAAAVTAESRAVQQLGTTQTATAATTQAMVGNSAEFQASLAADVRLLALKARMVDTTSAEAVAALQEEIAAEQENVAALGASEEATLRLAQVQQTLTARINQVTAAEEKAAAAAQGMSGVLGGLPNARLRITALAVDQIATSMSGGQVSALRFAGALGQATTTAGLMVPAIAPWAFAIGAAVSILTTFNQLLDQAIAKAAEVPKSFTESLGRMNEMALRTTITTLRTEIAAARDAIATELPGKFSGVFHPGKDIALEGNLNKLLTEYETAFSQLSDMQARASQSAREKATQLLQSQAQEAEAIQRALSDQSLELTAQEAHNAYAVKHAQVEKAFLDEVEKIDKLTTLSRQQRDRMIADAQEVAHRKNQLLDEEQGRMRTAYQIETALKFGDTAQIRYGAAIAAIENEARAAREAGESEVDVERRKTAQIRALRMQLLHDTMGNLGVIAQATEHSRSREIRAIGAAADTIRRIEIGAEGAKAAVKAAYYGAQAIGYAAEQKWTSAALAAASSIEFAAAAALAGQQAFGGSAGGGGGGGGGSDVGAGTFAPNQSPANGGLTLIVQTVDPTSGAVVNRTIAEIDRAQILNRPIPFTQGGVVISARNN
jgi:hypothetical protein